LAQHLGQLGVVLTFAAFFAFTFSSAVMGLSGGGAPPPSFAASAAAFFAVIFSSEGC
jgi:hypothetical protein